MDVQETIKAMTRRIADEFKPQQIVLFGSHARGNATQTSDVDILVATTEEVLRRGQIVGTLLRSALREGKVVYEHQ